jgi:hypothetical protein
MAATSTCRYGEGSVTEGVARMGLSWWARTQWVRGQRQSWREHDAMLAAAWGDNAAVSAEPEVTAQIIVLPEAGAERTGRRRASEVAAPRER